MDPADGRPVRPAMRPRQPAHRMTVPPLAARSAFRVPRGPWNALRYLASGIATRPVQLETPERSVPEAATLGCPSGLRIRPLVVLRLRDPLERPRAWNSRRG